MFRALQPLVSLPKQNMCSVAGSFAKLFDAQATAYAAYRYQYPPELYEIVANFIYPETTNLAVDVASGSGQATRGLCKYFDKVIALDANKEQLKHAPEINNVEFRYGVAERLDFEDDSVDLVTAAQALHWFDLPAFYKEARRVLHPKGSLAVWGYGVMLFDHEAADKALHSFYTKDVGPYWDARRKLIDAQYEGMEPSSQYFGVVQRTTVDMKKPMDLQQVIGYLSTWSAYQTYLARHPGGEDPLQRLRSQLIDILQWQDQNKVVQTRVPVFMILAKHPVKGGP